MAYEPNRPMSEKELMMMGMCIGGMSTMVRILNGELEICHNPEHPFVFEPTEKDKAFIEDTVNRVVGNRPKFIPMRVGDVALVMERMFDHFQKEHAKRFDK